MFCREHVAQLRDQDAEIAARGARTVVVGNGAAAFIAPFRKTTGFAGEILTDPTRAAFDAAGLARPGCLTFFGPRTLAAGIRSLARGFRQGRMQGDPWQQGGVLVVRPPGDVAYRYASRFAGDHPEPAAFLAALGARTG